MGYFPDTHLQKKRPVTCSDTQVKCSWIFYTFLHINICMFCRQLQTHQKKKKWARDPVLSFCQPSTKVTHEVCRGFHSYLELKTFFSSSLNIYHSTTVINNVNKQNKKKNTRSANLKYTVDYPLNWNPLMINHITLLTSIPSTRITPNTSN